MTTNQHPITPLREQVNKWSSETPVNERVCTYVATQAARCGADQELEACCDFLQELLAPSEWITGLRAVRRPKPPSDKELALEALERMQDQYPHLHNKATIRRALEALPE